MPGRTGGSSSGSSSSGSSSSSSSSYRSTYRNSGTGGSGGTGKWGPLSTAIVVGVIGLFILTTFSNNTNKPGSNAIKATTAADVMIMNAALMPRLTDWQAAAKDGVVHHISYQDAGLPNTFNTKEVVYGGCPDGRFYMVVLNADPGSGLNGGADSSGYWWSNQTSGQVSGSDCIPPAWRITSRDSTGEIWVYVNIATLDATRTAPPR